MNPRLVVIEGSLRGTVMPLAAGEPFPIGRSPSNRLAPPDRSVSYQHCLIQQKEGRWTICDLESHSGTFVNDLPVRERILQQGDRIRIGDSVLLFLMSEQESAVDYGLTLVDDDFLPMKGKAAHVEQHEAIEVSLSEDRTTPELSVLSKIGIVLSSVRDLRTLEQRLLELILEAVPAERGVIFLADANEREFSSVCKLARDPGQSWSLSISRRLIDRILQEGAAFLCNDISEGHARSRSLLAVPVILFEKVLGVIYVDTTDRDTHFDAGHVKTLTAIAGSAAVALNDALRMERLEAENVRLGAEINLGRNMVGESRRVREVYQFVAKVAPQDTTLLIRGESGTGKELVARAIHQSSPRASKPFVAIHCAALAEALLESELFGHEKGAFTGAIAQKRGKLEVAHGGTLFLDEIGDLSLTIQVKLLRVLQEREFERVGGTQPIEVDIRLITATHRNLEELIKNGTFRRDLYFRLNVIPVTMPPLRERREDIPLLANHFAAKFSEKARRRLMGISPEARACLLRYDWPGNVRELENAIERAVVLGSNDMILPEDLPEAVLEAGPSSGAPVTQYHDAVREAKKKIILDAVEKARGSYTEAAKLLGLHRNYLHRLIRNMNLRAELKKAAVGKETVRSSDSAR